jgi:predicted HicB family RNase H-like nuclease
MRKQSKATPASIYTAVRIPPDLLAQAKQRAEGDGRSLSNYIKNLIRKDLGEDESESAKKKAVKKRSSG